MVEKETIKTEENKTKENLMKLFKECEINEENVQQYIDSIIKEFYKPSPSIYAANTDTVKELQSKFGDSSIPKGIVCDKSNIKNYFSEIKTNVIDKSTRVSSPNMVGHMTSALPFFHRPLSKLITSLNQNVVKVETSATMTFLERETLSKLHRAFYNNTDEFYEKYLSTTEGTFGCVTSGGTIANLTAMWVARNNAFPKTEDFEGIEKEGVISALSYYGYNNMAIVGSELMHYSFKKAADILGMGLKNIYTIPVDSDYKMRIDLLIEKLEELKQKKIKVIAIVGIACTTEVGSIDKLDILADIAKKYGALFHVDGAWGGSFIMSNKYRHLLKGIEKADTITIDGHKLLYTPMGCGIVLFKSPLLPTTTIRKVASYVIRAGSMDHGKTTLEGSRPANVLYLHASLNLLGENGLSQLLDIGVNNAKYMAELIKSYPQFELISKPVTNIFLYRYIPSWLRKKSYEIEQIEVKSISSPVSTVSTIPSPTQATTALPIIESEEENHNDNDNSITFCNDTLKDQISDISDFTDKEGSLIYEESHYNDEENAIIDYFTTELQARQKREGEGFVSKTTVKTTKYPTYSKGVDVLRVVIANPLVTEDNIKAVVEEQIKLGEIIEEEYKMNHKLIK
jgi:glutamate decarboxylase